MATLKIKKPAGTSPTSRRDPVRGAGSGVKKRPTLAEAQSQRAEREARYQEQLRQRFGDAPPQEFSQRDDRGAPRSGASRDAAPQRERQNRDTRASGPRDSRGGPAEGPRRLAAQERPRRERSDAQSPGRGRGDERSSPARDHRDTRPSSPSRNNAFGAPASSSRREAAPRRDDWRAPPEAPSTQRAGPAAVFREDQRRRGNASAADPRTRQAAAQRRHREDDDDDGPYHAEQPGSVRLSKRMSELGMASRREADEWIPKGWVRVDGRVVSQLGSRVMPGQHISIDAKARNQQATRVTVLINKPVGYVSGQAEDGYEPALVLVKPENQWREDRSSIRFLPAHLRHLAPAGRLDIDSVGLLVLTQDGRIAKQLIGEDSEVEKEYLVRVHTQNNEPLPDSDLALLNHGLALDGEPLRPALVEWVNDDQLRFVLREGKKRQIRRMCEMVGLDVLGLKRVRIGQVMLGDLPAGQWRYLRGDESFVPVVPKTAE